MWCIGRPPTPQDWFLFGKTLNLQPADAAASHQSAAPPLAHSCPPPTSPLNLAHSRRAPQCRGRAGPPSRNSQFFPLAWETSGCWNRTVLSALHRLLYSFQLAVIKKKKRENHYVLFIECIIKANTVRVITLFMTRCNCWLCERCQKPSQHWVSGITWAALPKLIFLHFFV